jgi:hypothetical protein
MSRDSRPACLATSQRAGDDLNPHDSKVSKGPLRDEAERLHRDTTASNPTIKPVERLGSTRGEVELNANLSSAFV